MPNLGHPGVGGAGAFVVSGDNVSITSKLDAGSDGLGAGIVLSANELYVSGHTRSATGVDTACYWRAADDSFRAAVGVR